MNKTRIVIVGLLLSLVSGAFAQSTKGTYLDVTLPMHERINDLLSKMTLEEEMSLLTATSPGIPRLNIDKYYHGNEALHGVVRPGKHTVFPQGIALAAMWNPSLLHTIASAISDEARGQWNSLDYGRKQQRQFSDLLTFWSPTVNMARDPRWGRTPETYGEDPFLSGVLGSHFVRGLQGDDPRYLKVVSTPKHFAANNEENTRFLCNAIISEKQMREYYLPAFERCVKEGKSAAIMAAYNGINNVPCHANPWLLKKVLREDWGFNGYVVTDCGGLENLVNQHKFVKEYFTAAALGMKSGIDLECGDFVYMEPLMEAYKRNMVSKAEIDSAAYHVLRARMRLGLFDPVEMNPYNKIPVSVVGCEKHSQLALQAAREALVLLKNDKNILPLNLKKIKKIGILGINTQNCEFGDYSGIPVIEPISILDGIREHVAGKAEVLFAPWVDLPNGYEPLSASSFEGGITESYYPNDKSDEIVGTRKVENIYYEPTNQAPNPNAPLEYPYNVKWEGKLQVPVTGDYVFKSVGNDHTHIYINGEEKMYQPASHKEDSCVVRLEQGKTYDFRADYVCWTAGGKCNIYWHGADMKMRKGFERYGNAEEVLRKSDVAVVVIGTNQSIEREGLDRESIELPEVQKEFLRKAYEINPNIIVVLSAGSPMSITWENEHIPAILNAWYDGQAGGQAVAEALFGEYNPGGRLPVTYYKSMDDLLDFHDYDITKGRTYQYFRGEPLYPFGFGMSYTKFKYSACEAKVNDEDVSVSFTLKNAGKFDGDEVAQLYVTYLDGENDAYPLKQLRAFERVHLKKGEKRAVTFCVPKSELRFWDEAKGEFVTPSGRYRLQIGASSADTASSTIITL